MRRLRRTRKPMGFTMIELLVVIVILAMLVGLLLPAVLRAVGRAREAAVAAEIQALGQALADFKSKYGEYPPSRILIVEDGDYSTGNAAIPAAYQGLIPRSVSALKRYWPRLDIRTDGSKPKLPSPGFFDVNGDGKNEIVVNSKAYVLQGPECLVFFLGGIPQQTAGGWGMTGFAKNPANPFVTNDPTLGGTTNRTTPLYEFKSDRLVANSQNPATCSTGFPGFIDSLGAPTQGDVLPFYAYFSAYSGAGYDPNDCDFYASGGGSAETDSASGGNLAGAFFAPGSVVLGTKPSSYPTIPSLPPNPYTTNCPVPTGTNGDVAPGARPRVWANGNSYQLISPGLDRQYGIGGQWVSQGATRLPFIAAAAGYVPDSLQTQQANATVTSQAVSPDIRKRESDNVSNFAAGRLD